MRQASLDPMTKPACRRPRVCANVFLLVVWFPLVVAPRLVLSLRFFVDIDSGPFSSLHILPSVCTTLLHLLLAIFVHITHCTLVLITTYFSSHSGFIDVTSLPITSSVDHSVIFYCVPNRLREDYHFGITRIQL